MSISTIARPFFLTAALALLGAGLLLTIEGDVAFRSSWDAVTLALAHLGTLGFLSLVMLGLAYQVIASLTKSLPSSSLAYAVNALLVLGIISLVWSLRANATWSVLTSLSALGLGLIGSIVPGALSLRPGWRETTPAALLLALVSLLVTAFLGLWMLHGHGGMSFPGPRGLWVQVHLCVGLLGWVGCLQTALCWHLLPVTRPRAGTEERGALHASAWRWSASVSCWPSLSSSSIGSTSCAQQVSPGAGLPSWPSFLLPLPSGRCNRCRTCVGCPGDGISRATPCF